MLRFVVCEKHQVLDPSRVGLCHGAVFFFFGDGSDEGLNMLMGKSRGKVKLNRGHEIIFTCFLGGFAF